MLTIVLKADDPRIGTRDKAPVIDVMGNPYRKPVMSRAELGNGLYVVLPVQMHEPITVKLEAEKKGKTDYEVPDQA